MSNPMTYNDLSPAQLVELAVQRNEGHLAANGALVVETGHRTGRSPMDRYVVTSPAPPSTFTGAPLTVPSRRTSSMRSGIAWPRS